MVMENINMMMKMMKNATAGSSTLPQQVAEVI